MYGVGDVRASVFGRVEVVESARRDCCVRKGFLGVARGWGSLRALVVAPVPGERNWSHSDNGQRIRFIIDVDSTG